MKSRRQTLGLAAALAVVAVAAGACTAAPPPAVTTDASTPPGTPEAGVALVAQGCEPASISPPSVTESCGERVAELLFTQLVEYDAETGRARWGVGADRAMARRIASVDGRRWQIDIKTGWTFHDGEPVTAESFASAWNHVAYGPDNAPNAFLFGRILGFEQVRCTQPGCEPPPNAQELAGIEVEDDDTLVVTLAEPDRLFPAMLGHVAFSPLPSAAFEDPEGFTVAPIGNGPYRMDGAWEHEVAVRLARFDEYEGTPGGVDRIEFRLFDTPLEAYRRFLVGDLDVVQEVPPAARDDVRGAFGGRLAETPGDRYTFLAAPSYADIAAHPDMLAALSMAIDRRGLIARHLDDAADAATSLVAPVVPTAGGPNPCDRLCTHDSAEARRLLDAAGGWPDRGITVWFHDASDNRRLVKAIASQWREVFGLEPPQVRLIGLPLQEFIAHLEDRKATGLQFLSWVMDYPAPRNYLEPLHGPRGIFNFDRYENVQVTTWLRLAARARSEAESLGLYAQAEGAILADRHHLPLWYARHQAIHAHGVANVTLDPFGRVQLEDVTVLQPPER